jgi:hypothetical protein
MNRVVCIKNNDKTINSDRPCWECRLGKKGGPTFSGSEPALHGIILMTFLLRSGSIPGGKTLFSRSYPRLLPPPGIGDIPWIKEIFLRGNFALVVHFKAVNDPERTRGFDNPAMELHGNGGLLTVDITVNQLYRSQQGWQGRPPLCPERFLSL